MAFDYTNFLEVEATVESDFIFTNKNGVLNSGLSPSGTQLNWCLGNGTTPSTGTGPTANPAGRSGFIFTEGSETGTPASTLWAMRRNAVFDNTAQNIFVDIIHNLNCTAPSEYYVEYATVASPNETTDWTILETIVCNATDAWVADTFDFSAVPTTTTLRIRFRFSSSAAFTTDLAFSTWREYSVDTTTPGAGLFLSSADKTITTAGSENPSGMTFSASEENVGLSIVVPLDNSGASANKNLNPTSSIKGLITTGELRVKNGATINNLEIHSTGGFFLEEPINITNTKIFGALTLEAGGERNFTDVTVTGDILNTDAAANARIIVGGVSTLSTSTPGTGNGQVDIITAAVPISVTVLDEFQNPIAGAAVYLRTTGAQEVLNGTTNASGVLSGSFFGATPAAIDTTVSGVKAGSHAIPYQYYTLGGQIEPSGYAQTVILNED